MNQEKCSIKLCKQTAVFSDWQSVYFCKECKDKRVAEYGRDAAGNFDMIEE